MARGSIIRRRSKAGATTFTIKYRAADGRQVKKAIGDNRKDAEQALTAALAKVDRGESPSTSRETFGQAAERWLRRKRPIIEASTYRDYETHLRLRLLPTFGKRKLTQITRAHVEDYLAHLDATSGLSRKTINDSLIPLRQILGRAVRDGVIATNPAQSTDRDSALELPYEPPTMHYLNRGDALRYLDACPDWYRPLAEVLIGAGLRIGEAIALEWRDIAWESNALSITRSAKYGGTGTPKGDKARTVHIAPYLLDVLTDHRAQQAHQQGLGQLVFPSQAGTMLNRHNVRRRGHGHALKDAGLSPTVRLHDLRHSAATLWLAAGESIYFVQQQLGHADIQTTIDLYGHPDQAAHRDAAARAAAWWREAPPEGVSGTTAGTTALRPTAAISVEPATTGPNAIEEPA